MTVIKKILSLFLMSSLFIYSCEGDFDEINTDQDRPEIAPTWTIFNAATKRLMDDSRDQWASGRLVLPWIQYSAQRTYTEEDKYQYRPTTGDQVWNNHYRVANNLKSIIDFCISPETMGEMANYGSLNNQIGVSRIMLAYVFSELANHFGDVPYWSHSGRTNPDFQALQIETYPQPKYVEQSLIFADILKELREAVNQLDPDDAVPVFQGARNGDKIYYGDVSKWKKFGNSLRLRIANQIKAVYPNAQIEIEDAIASGVFTSNDDNAVQHYGNSSIEGSPFWAAYFVDNRTDFFVNGQFIKLLKGESGNFGVDPRLQKIAAPKGTNKFDIPIMGYTESDDINNYAGMPYGLPQNRLSSNNSNSKNSLFSGHILKSDYSEVLMEYAEVEFLLSEVYNWSQDNYERGVRASMEKWGVAPDKINEYISSLPAANQENVITQKYIALFMQPQTAWVEYRRTGYPNGSILLLPGGTGYEHDGTPYIFTPLVPDISDIPNRISYPLSEQTINGRNWSDAVSRLNNGDNINSKLYWDIN